MILPNMDIRMPRGDRKVVVLRLLGKDGSAFQIEPDEIYFTVKASALDREYKFQKRLSDGGIEMMEAGKYKITINPEDTDNLLFYTYDYDIEVVKENTLKKTFIGRLLLEKEVTHHCNEGV